MAIILKTKEEIEIICEGGKRLAHVLQKLREFVRPGITTKEIDTYAEKLIRDQGDTPAFLHYRPEGAAYAYPASVCISVNDEVVHGIPSSSKVLKEGDIISLDTGINHKGMFTDSAITVAVGNISHDAQNILAVTEEALRVAIEAAQVGNTVGDIGYAVEQYVKQNGNYGIIKILSGHGVGKEIHEDPFIPNFGKKGTGEKLVAGMVVALEPMLNIGSHKVFLDKDQWTYKTSDGSLSAHFEHTIAITENGPEILTKL